jgi:hypothetical protein
MRLVRRRRKVSKMMDVERRKAILKGRGGEPKDDSFLEMLTV